ncbi:MAG: hypothetical protein WBN65_09300 [Gammaproteobacteria bacterium]
MNTGRHWHGGASDTAEVELQADVMRFVAILALCLVAISTMVEQASSQDTPAAGIAEPVSVPSDPVSVTTPVSPTPPPTSSTRVADAGVVTLPVPQSAPAPVPRQKKPATQPPRPETLAAAPPSPAVVPKPMPRATPVTEPAPEPQPEPESNAEPTPVAEADPTPGPTPEERGFTLRFDSDAAMLRMVSRGEAGVFLIDGARAWRLGFGDLGAQFAEAPPPSRFHAIAAGTVPRLLRDAATRSPGIREAVWGVTLPNHTSRDLAALLRAHDHGELIIDRRGRVRMESADEA